jgi:hypothetical protein
MRKPRQVTSRASGKSRCVAMTRRRLLAAVRPVSMARPKTAEAAADDATDKPTTCCRNSGAHSKIPKFNRDRHGERAPIDPNAGQASSRGPRWKLRPNREAAFYQTKAGLLRQRPHRQARHCASLKQLRDTGSSLRGATIPKA